MEPTNPSPPDDLVRRYFSPENFSSLAQAFHRTKLSAINEWMEMLDLLAYEKRGHSYRVTKLSLRLGRILHFDEEELLVVGGSALLHDIGKIRIPKELLTKPGKLTTEEREIMKRHSGIGAEILQGFPSLECARGPVEQHHERWNGSGYPMGLKGEKIARAARLIGIVDSYEAMVDQRSYNRVKSHEEADTELLRYSGILYDPEMVAAFVALKREDIRTILESDEESSFLETIFPMETLFRVLPPPADLMERVLSSNDGKQL